MAVLAQQEVPVVASVPAQLPAVRGDRARLRQVLGNLIENAVKYSPEGAEVRVSAAAANGAVRIAVRDGGPGIPRDQQARIFEKFGRVDVPGASKPGTGLGLFIARSIAEAQGLAASAPAPSRARRSRSRCPQDGRTLAQEDPRVIRGWSTVGSGSPRRTRRQGRANTMGRVSKSVSKLRASRRSRRRSCTARSGATLSGRSRRRQGPSARRDKAHADRIDRNHARMKRRRRPRPTSCSTCCNRKRASPGRTRT